MSTKSAPVAGIAALVGVVLAFIPGCADRSRETLGTSSAEILGGQAIPASEYPTVLAIQVGASLCTGTLVAPDLVLTAAHCVDAESLGFSSQAALNQQAVVIVDAAVVSSATGSQVVGVVDSDPHPQYFSPGNPDIAVVRLARPITDREPSPISLDPNLGQGVSVDMVGFGITDDGSFGTKFSVENVPAGSCSTYGQSDSMFLCYSHQNGPGKCNGDSGGPSFATIAGRRTVVGITSYGDTDCEVFSADMKVSSARPFLAQSAPELLCARDGYCDPSCEAESRIDGDCRTICATDSECADNQYCEGGEFCAAMPFSPGGIGAECGEGLADCESTICGASGEESRCTQVCAPGAGDCPSGFDCLDTGDGGGACWPQPEADISGGCVASSSAPSGLPVWFLLAAVCCLRLRRRRD